jgi:uncharacterized MAPEG superfamily protein
MWQHGPALITALAVLLFFACTANVGRARGRYGIKAPATSGHPDFERVFRVQMNTLESLVMVVPSLWLFATYESFQWATILGAVWLVGRILYAITYTRDASARGPGFLIGMLSSITLLVGGLYGILKAVFA